MKKKRSRAVSKKGKLKKEKKVKKIEKKRKEMGLTVLVGLLRAVAPTNTH